MPETGAEARLVVALDLEADSLRGEVHAPGEPGRSFAGWLALLSVLEPAIERLRREGRSEGTEPAEERSEPEGPQSGTG